jgi:hypothetical protein
MAFRNRRGHPRGTTLRLTGLADAISLDLFCGDLMVACIMGNLYPGPEKAARAPPKDSELMNRRTSG